MWEDAISLFVHLGVFLSLITSCLSLIGQCAVTTAVVYKYTQCNVGTMYVQEHTELQ